jgi:hypothetical protein
MDSFDNLNNESLNKKNRFILFNNYKNHIIKNKSDKIVIGDLRMTACHW